MVYNLGMILIKLISSHKTRYILFDNPLRLNVFLDNHRLKLTREDSIYKVYSNAFFVAYEIKKMEMNCHE